MRFLDENFKETPLEDAEILDMARERLPTAKYSKQKQINPQMIYFQLLKNTLDA